MNVFTAKKCNNCNYISESIKYVYKKIKRKICNAVFVIIIKYEAQADHLRLFFINSSTHLLHPCHNGDAVLSFCGADEGSAAAETIRAHNHNSSLRGIQGGQQVRSCHIHVANACQIESLWQRCEHYTPLVSACSE